MALVGRLFRFAFTLHGNHRLLGAAFITLSLMDLVLTWLLVGDGSGQVYEANPLAGYVLEHFGWVGMSCFKVASMLTALGALALVSRRLPGVGRRLLAVACPCLLGLVGYSVVLLTAGRDLEGQADLDAAFLRANDLDEEFRQGRAYARLVDELAYELAAGRGTLTDAVGQLNRHLAETGYDPLVRLRMRYPGLSDDACLAANLVRLAGLTRRDQPELTEPCLSRMATEFQATWGLPLPGFAVAPHLNTDPHAVLHGPAVRLAALTCFLGAAH